MSPIGCSTTVGWCEGAPVPLKLLFDVQIGSGCSPSVDSGSFWHGPYDRPPSCLVLSCLLTLYTAVMSFEILFPFGLWVIEPDWPAPGPEPEKCPPAAHMSFRHQVKLRTSWGGQDWVLGLWRSCTMRCYIEWLRYHSKGRGKTRVHREIFHGLLLNKFYHPERTRINNMGHAAAGIKNWACFVAE